MESLSVTVMPKEQIREPPATALARAGMAHSQKTRGLPNVPAVNEFVPGYELGTWAGKGTPKDTPVEIIDRLNKEINAGLASPQIQAKYADLGTILTISLAEFRKLLADDIAKWAKVIQAANIKPE